MPEEAFVGLVTFVGTSRLQWKTADAGHDFKKKRKPSDAPKACFIKGRAIFSLPAAHPRLLNVRG